MKPRISHGSAIDQPLMEPLAAECSTTGVLLYVLCHLVSQRGEVLTLSRRTDNHDRLELFYSVYDRIWSGLVSSSGYERAQSPEQVQNVRFLSHCLYLPVLYLSYMHRPFMHGSGAEQVASLHQ